MVDLVAKLAIISLTLGVILLVVIADKVSLPSSTISSISKEDLNKEVKISGTVKKSINKDALTLLELSDKTGTIDVVAFKSKEMYIKKGSFIELEGKVSLYEDNLQVIAENIKLVN